MAKVTLGNLLLLGVLFHVAYIWSIFDIYFTSPLVHGMEPHRVEAPPPAKRLVLFVADGLRADKLFQLYPVTNDDGSVKKLETKAPYIRDVVLHRGTWGISHTRVPTESRPGHVAIIAGFYEDVSAVTKGWKSNPVEFDSVFNQSRHTWSFGSPDILPMFGNGASDPDRVDMYMYAPEFEDFGTRDASVLDMWVAEQLNELFANSSSNPKIYKQLHDDQIIFFLHLLGLDTNGHAYRPHSEVYLNNIKVVDRIVRETVELMDRFYKNDGKTAYVFTADHGMSNIGNHGDGHPDNTRTPLVVWGAGVNKPNTTHPYGHDEISSGWQLGQIQRNDVLQADIAPLMASLIGINYPVNSVGQLPLAYLGNTPQFKAQSAFVNAMEILEQYRVKYEQKAQTELMFKPFAALSNSTHNPEVLLKNIIALIDAEKYEDAELLCVRLAELCLQGLRYFQTYDWLMLRSIVTAGFLGWIMYSLTFTLCEYVIPLQVINDKVKVAKSEDPYQMLINVCTASSLALLTYVLYVQESPWTYYTYIVFPVFFWSEVAKQRHMLTIAWQVITGNHGFVRVLSYIVGFLMFLQVLVYSYFERGMLSACFWLAALWPVFIPSHVKSENRVLLLMWSVSCAGTSIFTLLPVEKGEDITLVMFGGALITATGLIAYWHSQTFVQANDRIAVKLIGFQVALIVLSIIVVYDTTSKLNARSGLPLLNQIVAWTILVIATSTPFAYGLRKHQHYLQRLVTIYLAFAPLFVLLSISYEALFYCCFSITLLLWIKTEHAVYISHPENNIMIDSSSKPAASPTRKLSFRDVRTAAMFLFFVKIAFFGTGNVASLSSFSLQSVYRLTTVFDPFLMGALLLLKIFIPFIAVSTALRVVTHNLDLPPFGPFLLVLATSDFMTLNFFYLVRDDGSWLEIGTTISHFCISSLFVLFMIVLFALGHLLVGHVLVENNTDEGLQRKDKAKFV